MCVCVWGGGVILKFLLYKSPRIAHHMAPRSGFLLQLFLPMLLTPCLLAASHFLPRSGPAIAGSNEVPVFLGIHCRLVLHVATLPRSRSASRAPFRHVHLLSMDTVANKDNKAPGTGSSGILGGCSVFLKS